MSVIAKEPLIVRSEPDTLGEALSSIRHYVAESSKEAGLSKETFYQLRLAVDEIATNILIHGYEDAGIEGELITSATIDDEMLMITLEDWAEPYDPRTKEAPTDLETTLDTREIGGLGIYLALINVDFFDYERVDGKNVNRFGMKRNLKPVEENKPTYNILLKSNSERLVDEIRQGLRSDDFNLVVVEDGAALLEVLRNGTCDLILFHIDNLDSGDIDLMTCIHASSDTQIPIVIVSRGLDTDPILRCIDIGADDYLPSPQSPTLLKMRIKVNIERYRIQQEKVKNLVKVEEGIKHVLFTDPVVAVNGPILNIDAFLHRALSEIKGMYNADAGTVYFVDDDKLRFIVTQTDSLGLTHGGASNQPINFAPLPLYNADKSPNKHNIATYVALSGEAMNVPDIYSATNFDFSATKAFDKANHYKSNSCLTVPLKDHQSKVIAVIQLLNAQDDNGHCIPFDSSKQSITESLCAYIGTMLSNRLLIQQQLAMNQIEHDIQIGRQIQQAFLPTVFPSVPGWEIASYFHPAREVAGDFYDVFEMPGNRLGLVIADVCDKGVGAALFMSLMRSLIRAYALQNYTVDWSKLMETGQVQVRKQSNISVKKVMPSAGSMALTNAIQLTNQYVSKQHGDLNMFATTFFGVLDPIKGSLLYINGGHCSPMIIDASGKIIERLDPTGPAVGMFSDSTFELKEVDLHDGESLFAFTDGVTDIRNPEGQLFKETALLPLLQQPISSIQELLGQVRDKLIDFKGDAVQFDDITMLGLRREPRQFNSSKLQDEHKPESHKEDVLGKALKSLSDL